MSPIRLGLAVFVAVFGLSGVALGANTIKSDDDHPNYFFEAEPHLVLTPFRDGGIGAGFAGTFNVANHGFINRLNDSVGVGFAANWLTNDHFILSGGMQWNFWFTEHWSAFGEVGLAFGAGDKIFWPNGAAGGRYAFNDTIALTLRLGFPASSFGVSFLF